MQKALSKIVDNALKFTESGFCKISVKPLEEFIQIDVTDSGPGISEAKLDHVFDRFNQIEMGVDRPHEGLGIGLSISKIDVFLSFFIIPIP